jgi:hypothetical protein
LSLREREIERVREMEVYVEDDEVELTSLKACSSWYSLLRMTEIVQKKKKKKKDYDKTVKKL